VKTADRTLALLDVENLLYTEPRGAIDADYRQAILHTAAVADLDRSSIVVLGLGARNTAGVFASKATWPPAALRCEAGKDGGELSLLHYANDLHAIARSYSRVVIGSGDGEFTDFAAGLGCLGVQTTVVSWRCKLSRRLRMAAGEVRLLDTQVESAQVAVLAA